MHLAQDSPKVNGSTDYGKNVAERLKKEEDLERSSVQKLSHEQDHVLKTFRLLIADLCQQFNGGHPGYVSSRRTMRERTDEGKRCDWHGSYWSRIVEVRDAIRTAHADLL